MSDLTDVHKTSAEEEHFSHFNSVPETRLDLFLITLQYLLNHTDGKFWRDNYKKKNPTFYLSMCDGLFFFPPKTISTT